MRLRCATAFPAESFATLPPVPAAAAEFDRGGSANQSNIRIPVYADTAGKARDNVFAAHGKQENDPLLGAQAIITAIEANQPPLHLVIGGDALDQIRQKLVALQNDLNTWEELTRSTKFQE